MINTPMGRKMAERAYTGLKALEALQALSPSARQHAGSVMNELLAGMEPDAAKQTKTAARLKLRAETMLAFPMDKTKAKAPAAA